MIQVKKKQILIKIIGFIRLIDLIKKAKIST